MANTLKDYYQSEIDKCIEEIQNWTKDPVLNVNNEIVISVNDKLNLLASYRNRAESAYTNIRGIDFNTAAVNAALANINTGVYPAIFGVKSWYSDSGRKSITSEWAGGATRNHWLKLLALTAGLYDPTNLYAAWPAAQTYYEISPYLVPNCHRMYESCNVGCDSEIRAASSNNYYYPSKPFCILTIKNTNLTTDKTTTVRVNGSSNSSNGEYTYSYIISFTPDNTNSNRSIIDEAVTFNTTSAISGNPGFFINTSTSTNSANSTLTATIKVPANKTVIVMAVNPSYYYSSSYHYLFDRNLTLENISTTYNDPELVPDVAILKNIMNKNLNTLGQLYTNIPA